MFYILIILFVYLKINSGNILCCDSCHEPKVNNARFNKNFVQTSNNDELSKNNLYIDDDENTNNDIVPCRYGINKNFVKVCTDDLFFEAYVLPIIESKNKIKKWPIRELNVKCDGYYFISKKVLIDYYKCKLLKSLTMQDHFIKLYLISNIKHEHLKTGKLPANVAWHIFSFLNSKDLFHFSLNKDVRDSYVCVYYCNYISISKNMSNNDELDELRKKLALTIINMNWK